MTWDDILIRIADKHNISLKSCFSTEEKETRIQQKLEPAKYQGYKIKYLYKSDKWVDVKSPI